MSVVSLPRAGANGRLSLAVPSKGRMSGPALELCAAAGLAFTALARNVHEELRLARISDIDDRGAVVFELAGHRIHARAAVQADVGNPAPVLLDDGRLIGAARLQIVKADYDKWGPPIRESGFKPD